ncbi:MAG: ATP synthase F1 subunit delta [Flavobacteriales bacterium]|nr:ATP synthase F1 subunit delta [Flavobacteriales bacterium]
MAESKVASRYAKAFLDLVSEKGKLDEALKDMELLIGTVSENRDLLLLLKSPVVHTEKKVSILKSIFEKNLSEASMLFVTLVTKKRREGTLLEIAKEFIAQYKQMKNITTANVSSAAVLSADAKKRILDIVQKQVGGTVELQEEVNPDLIGGFVLRIGDQQLDTSILAKVNSLRQEFGKNFYVKEL